MASAGSAFAGAGPIGAVITKAGGPSRRAWWGSWRGLSNTCDQSGKSEPGDNQHRTVQCLHICTPISVNLEDKAHPSYDERKRQHKAHC